MTNAKRRHITLYIVSGFDEYEARPEKLGKHKTGKSFLYVNKLADVDTSIQAIRVKSKSFESRVHRKCTAH